VGGLGLAGIGLALGAQLLDQGLAVAGEAVIVRRRLDAGALAALATIASSSRCEQRPRVTGSLGWMLAMFQWVRSRIAAMVVRVVPISLPIWPSEISGWLRMIQAMPSGLSWRLETGV
jgi:hypothetical protein